MLSINVYASPEEFNPENPRAHLSNKIQVSTTYSQDGRQRESFYLEYNPNDMMALFLFEEVLNSSNTVIQYRVYDTDGKPVKNFRTEHHPKRV